MKKTFIKAITIFLTVLVAGTASIQSKNTQAAEITKEENGTSYSQHIKDGTITLKTRSKEQIRSKARELRHSGVDEVSIKNIYLEKPSTENPYKAGKLTDEFLQDGLNAVNMVRYIAGYPSDITLDNNYNSLAQHGAIVLGAINDITHYPSKPSDMPQDFFDKGADATSISNLHSCYNNHGKNCTLSEAILGFMNDSDERNVERVGHRRWLLNPEMKKSGLGYVKNKAEYQYVDQYAFDTSRIEKVDYDFIAWPSKGVFPTEYFNSKEAWSVNLNEEKYSVPNINKVKVEMKRRRDGRVWNLDKSTISKNGDYFNVNNDRCGKPNCIIFRPADVESYKDGDIFDITIAGIEKSNGSSTTINYSVEYFNINPRGWINENGNWHYYDEKGTMKTGLVAIDDKKYYLDNNGVMKTGWISINGKDYYFNDDGSAAKGWLLSSGKWYYFHDFGNHMVTGEEYIDEKYYLFNSSGQMTTGWNYNDIKWQYYNDNGAKIIYDWKYINGSWYYFDCIGNMATGLTYIDFDKYYFNESGSMYTGWKYINGHWYYFKSSGSAVVGWQFIDGKWYNFDWNNKLV